MSAYTSSEREREAQRDTPIAIYARDDHSFIGKILALSEAKSDQVSTR